MTTTNLMDHHRNREARILTGVGVLVCGTGLLTTLAPGVEHAITVGLLVLAGIVGLTLGMRVVLRKVREHAEDQADTATAAAWQVNHRNSRAVGIVNTRGVA